METTKMGTTKKSATKPNKRFLGAGTKRMTSRSLQNSKSGSRLFYQIALKSTAELKKKVIEAMTPKPKPIMMAPGFAKLVFDLLGTTTLPDPNKSISLALKALITEVDDFLLLALWCKPELLKCCNDMVLSNASLDRSI